MTKGGGSMSANVLVLDIETRPNLAYVWSLWDQNVALNQIREVGQVISFAWRWHGNKHIGFVSDYHNSHEAMVELAHGLLDQADAVVTWNGQSFDIPHLQREIILAGHKPPSPFKQIDLLLTTRKQFKFASNKLDHVAQQLGVGKKTTHSGFTLWRRCMDGDPEAWALMRRYNVHDVRITDAVYDRLKPWIVQHPHLGLYDGDKAACGRCGGKLQRRGTATTLLSTFQRWQCTGCGGWSRTGKRIDGVDVRPTG